MFVVGSNLQIEVSYEWYVWYFLVDGYNFANYFFCLFWIRLWIVWWILDYIFWGKIQLVDRSFLVFRCWILFLVNGFCWKVIYQCEWHCLDKARVEASSDTFGEEETFKVGHPLYLFNSFVSKGFLTFVTVAKCERGGQF